MVADPVPTLPAYSIRRSRRARRSRLTISDSGAVVVVLPLRAAAGDAEPLVTLHHAWIERHLERLERRRRALALRPSLAAGRVLSVAGQPRLVRATNDDERRTLEMRLRREARRLLAARVAHWAPVLGVEVARITIRDQRTRWGSASRNGTLSFSWRLLLTPPEIVEYVVIHELAHLRHAGHGRSFWALVARHYPDHLAARRWLREHHHEIRHALD